MRCPACHTENPDSSAQCLFCGTELSAPAADRKLVTVLFADLVGHTAVQTRVDPEDWWRFQRAYAQAMETPIRRYGGEIEKFIGDAIFAVFGIPQSHEDDPERAVRAALEMREALRPLNETYARSLGAAVTLRIGVATGEAIAPRRRSGQQLVLGELTSLAERLQAQAPSNGIVISESAHTFVSSVVETEPLGELALKGFPAAVAARLVTGLTARTRATRAAGLRAPLVDREQELAALLDACAKLRAGRGHILALIGDAGLGKSRLIAEVQARLTEIRVVSARCHEFSSSVAYSAVIHQVRGFLDAPESEAPDDARRRLVEVIGDIAPDFPAEAQQALEHLLGTDVLGHFEQRTRGLAPEDVRAEIVRALTRFWDAAVRGQSLLLVVEDLHWVDSASGAVLSALLPLTERLPFVLLCVFRPERRSPAWELKVTAERDYPHRYSEVWLRPLSRFHVEELAELLLVQAGLAPALKQTVADRSEGNPFYAEEVVWSLRQPPTAGGGAPLPATLKGVLQARLDALPAPAREVLQTASVIGRTFSHRHLQAITADAADLTDPLLELQRADFLIEQQRLPDPVYSFKHALLHEATYASLLREQRRVLHRSLAQAMERESAAGYDLAIIAGHFAEGQEWPKAIDYAERAAVWAREVGAAEQAADQYLHAIEIAAEHPDAATIERVSRLREACGDLLLQMGRFDEARAQFETLTKAADAPSAHAHALRRVAEAYWRAGDLKQAVEHLHQALALLPPAGDPAEEAGIHLDLGYVEDLMGGQADAVLAHCEKAKRLAAGGPPLLNARVYRLFTIAYVHRGELNLALDAAKQTVMFASAGGDPLEMANAHNNLAYVYRQKGELRLAKEHVDIGLSLAEASEQWRATDQLAILYATMGELLLDQGEWQRAEQMLQQGLRSLERAGPRPRLRLELLADLAEALLGQQRGPEALVRLQESERLRELYPLHRFVPKLRRIRAEAYLQADDVQRAEEASREGLHAIDLYGSDVERPALLRVLATIALRRGESATALQRLRDAAALLAARGQLPELGRVHAETARAWLAQGDPESAADAARLARRIFERLGAVRLAAEVDQLATPL